MEYFTMNNGQKIPVIGLGTNTIARPGGDEEALITGVEFGIPFTGQRDCLQQRSRHRASDRAFEYPARRAFHRHENRLQGGHDRYA